MRQMHFFTNGSRLDVIFEITTLNAIYKMKLKLAKTFLLMICILKHFLSIHLFMNAKGLNQNQMKFSNECNLEFTNNSKQTEKTVVIQ